jgi:hypothetical protein
MDRNTNKNEQDSNFPGYPHYPSKEDITNPGNGNKKVELDAEELANSGRLSAVKASDESENLSEDADLDIPGADLDDQNEEIGEEDEENNYYSLGGDRHEDLDERQDD